MAEFSAPTTGCYHPDLPVDLHHTPLTAAARLGEEFSGIYGRPTVERFPHSSYDQFAANSTIPSFLPLIAERFARQRLRAPGFFAQPAGEAAVGWSGGSEPGTEVNPAAVAAMAERGIDISDEFPKPWTDEIVQAADAVITMGCGDAYPIFPGKTYQDWDVTDPAGQDIEHVRAIRDDIERRIRHLLDQLHIPTS